MIILTNRLSDPPNLKADFTLFLTAEQRQRSRQRISLNDRQIFYLKLPRGTILKEGDLLGSENEDVTVAIAAQKEPVMTVTAAQKLALIKAAYHLGNRHVALEITEHYLRLSPDPILGSMLIKLGLEVQEELANFYPEIGAYNH
jgi:urease accessory protein